MVGHVSMERALTIRALCTYEAERFDMIQAKLDDIKDEDLPLHLHDTWEYAWTHTNFLKRLKGKTAT